jgi:hypothetical protein
MSFSNASAKAELIGTYIEGFCYGEFTCKSFDPDDNHNIND